MEVRVYDSQGPLYYYYYYYSVIIRFNDICFVYNILKNNNASFSGEKVANRAEQSSRRILLVVGAF